MDASPDQHQRAVTRYPDTPLHLVCVDAVAHLRDTDPYDLIYSVGSLPYLNPHRLLPPDQRPQTGRTAARLRAAHQLERRRAVGRGGPQPEILRLPGTTDDHLVRMWVLTPQLWEDLLGSVRSIMLVVRVRMCRRRA
ncbi:hypothetical protein SMA5143A_8277 [Streptomyces sp. MA5143a]|nr:hypothetical protein SMA5143A_8277 [Streptomyces sp. MA5143a]